MTDRDTFVLTPLELAPAYDQDQHAARLHEIHAYLGTVGALAELSNGGALELRLVTTPAQRQLLVLEALRTLENPYSVNGATAADVARRLIDQLPDGVTIVGARDHEFYEVSPEAKRVRQATSAALTQLARRGFAYRARRWGRETWHAAP